MHRLNVALVLICTLSALGFVGASLNPIQLQPQPVALTAKAKAVEVPTPDVPEVSKPDPAMLALVAGASNWSVAAANVHIQKMLEQVRLDAVKRGVDPDAAARQFQEQEIKHWRFISWHAVAMHPSLRVWQRMTRWWLAQMSTVAAYVAPVEVPGTHSLMWQLDIRDYGWNTVAFRAVALRETYTRSIQVDHAFAGVDIAQIDLLQRFIGEKRVKVVERLLINGQRVDVDTFPAIGVIRADWLFRDTIETDRSPSYYDLLYSSRRFPEKQHHSETYTVSEPYIVRETVYDPYYRAYVYRDVTHYREVQKTRHVEVGNRAVVDFPRDRKDWDEFWGVKVLRDFAKKQKFDLRFGAVVPGSRDDPRGGSIVARNNRIIAIWDNGAMETVDVAKTARGEDFVEQPVEVSLDQIEGENGEFLARLPNGGQAALLVAANKRVEFATGRFVHPKFADQRNPDVRTPQCLVCHAGSGGVIPPRSLFAEYLRDGVELKINDRITRNKVRAFMLAWDHKIKGLQEPYLHLIRVATADPVTGKPLTPDALVKEFLAFRDWYDDPLTPQQAGWEYGVPDALRFRSIAGKATTGRLQALSKGVAVPREAWERDSYLGLQATEYRRLR